MSTDSSNPILRRLGVAGVGDERHFSASITGPAISAICASIFDDNYSVLRASSSGRHQDWHLRGTLACP